MSNKRGGLTGRAYDHIKQLLITGTANDMDWFPIEPIAASLDMSRQPVMDALKRLSIEGYVEIVPQVGCRPRTPQIEEIRDFFRLFSEGEALIAELAAKRADEDEVLGMRLVSQEIGNLRNSAEKDSVKNDQYRKLNCRLHGTIRHAAKSPMIAEMAERLGERTDFYIASAHGRIFAPNVEVAHAEHEEIIEAIASKNSRKARSAMRRHILATERRLEAAMAVSQENQRGDSPSSAGVRAPAKKTSRNG